MNWPDQPLEQRPGGAFVPKFCPRPECADHRRRESRSFRFRSHGSFKRKSDGRVVRRFLCPRCRRTFSVQTFCFTYYLKRPELVAAVAAGLLAGSAHRQIARSLACSHATVTRMAARLGRHALLLLARALDQLPRIDEPVVYDDFESFVFSQDTPFGMGTAVGQDSWFIYALEQAPHRRGGRRSPARAARKAVSHAVRGAYRRAFQRTLDLLAPKVPPGGRLRMVTDDHPGYRAGLRHHPERAAFEHRCFPNPFRPFKGAPRSAAARERDRQMFAVDLLHGLMRHSLAHHRRETLAFGRRLNALMERGFLTAVWRNFVKGRSERRPDPTTPAMKLGLASAPWSWAKVLAQRLFPTRVEVPRPWMRIYRRELITPQVGRNLPHRLSNAF